MMGATILPQAVFDVRAGARRVSPPSGSACCPGRRRSTSRSSTTPSRDEHDLSSLRLAVTGAAAIPVELVQRMRDELTFETIITGYGLTEACGIATMCRHDDDPETIATTSGRAIPGIEVRVVDERRRRGAPRRARRGRGPRATT